MTETRIKSEPTSKIIPTLIFIIFFLYSAFLAYGMPLWDDDYGIWFNNILDQSWSDILLKILNPISQQAQNWAFNERPVQDLFYFITYHFFGYQTLPLVIFKSLFTATACLSIYFWLRKSAQASHLTGFLAAILFISIPGPVAAHILFQDFAPLAVALFSFAVLYATQYLKNENFTWAADKKKFLIVWFSLLAMVYIGSKVKGDLKLVPIVLGLFVLLFARKRIWQYAPFILFMLLLSIPWGTGLFEKAPPFMPGSQGSSVNWMFQPASLRSTLEYLRSTQNVATERYLVDANLSLSKMFGPFLWGAIIIACIVLRKRLKDFWLKQKHALSAIAIWCVVIIAGMSALAELNYFFRIRYSILTALPFAILSGFFLSFIFKSKNRWATAIVIVGLSAQLFVNFSRSIRYRQDAGEFLTAIDSAYKKVESTYSNLRVVTYFNFLPFAYKSQVKNIREKIVTRSEDEFLAATEPNPQVVISLSPIFHGDMLFAEKFNGCSTDIIFVKIFGCQNGIRSYVSLRMPGDPEFPVAKSKWLNGEISAAKFGFLNVLQRQPNNYEALRGLAATSLSTADYLNAQKAYEKLVEIDDKKIEYLEGLKAAYTALKLDNEAQRIDSLIKKLGH